MMNVANLSNRLMAAEGSINRQIRRQYESPKKSSRKIEEKLKSNANYWTHQTQEKKNKVVIAVV